MMYNILLNFCAEKTLEVCEKAVDKDPRNLKYVPYSHISHEMRVKAIDRYPKNLRYVPDKFKTQNMCDKAVDEYPYNLRYVPDCFITQEMCVKAFNVNPYNYNFEYIPDRLKTQEMCSDVYDNCSCPITDDIPDWFITPEMIENSDGCCDSCDDKFHGYKERKAQKAQIKDELTPIAWHPDRVINWCFDEEEKKDLKRLWGSVEL